AKTVLQWSGSAATTAASSGGGPDSSVVSAVSHPAPQIRATRPMIQLSTKRPDPARLIVRVVVVFPCPRAGPLHTSARFLFDVASSGERFRGCLVWPRSRESGAGSREPPIGSTPNGSGEDEPPLPGDHPRVVPSGRSS